MSDLSDRVTKLERRFHYIAIVAFFVVVGVGFFGYHQVFTLPQIASKAAIDYVNSEKFPLRLKGSLNLKSMDLVFRSGTIAPDMWGKLQKGTGGMNGIEYKVEEDLSDIHQPRIFLSRRGNGHIWESQGLSAYPHIDAAGTEEEWNNGFRIIINAGTLDHRKKDGKRIGDGLLKIAQTSKWHVDWFVIGAPKDRNSE